MAFISLGLIDKNIFTIILSCVFCFLNRLVNQVKRTLLYNNIILTVTYILIPKFLAVIPTIIFIIKSKLSDNNKKNINQPMDVYLNKHNKESNKAKWAYIILSTLVLYIYLFLLVYASKIKTNSWIWYIAIVSIFSYLIFKIKLYKHHYLSIIFILLFGLIIDLVSENLQSEIINDTLELSMKLIKEILLALYCVLAKYVIDKYYVTVYDFSFYMGLFGLIISGVISIFDYYITKINNDNYHEYFNNYNTRELLVMLGIIITQFGLNLTMLFIIKNNSPCHVFIMFVFGQIAYYLDFKNDSIITIICLIIILFFSLIFNEIIEINIFGLSFNTRKNISKRAIAEEKLLKIKTSYTNESIENGGYIIEMREDSIYKRDSVSVSVY